MVAPWWCREKLSAPVNEGMWFRKCRHPANCRDSITTIGRMPIIGGVLGQLSLILRDNAQIEEKGYPLAGENVLMGGWSNAVGKGRCLVYL
jgi:hypothetical protein